MITWGKCFDLISNSLNLLLKECIKINMENCTRTLGLGGLRGMDLTRYGVCKSSDRTKTRCLLRSIQVKFTIAKRLYIVTKISPKDLRTISSSLLCT